MKIVAIASGKGGVGKTTLTANLGAALASSGYRVVLFDGDLGLADLDIALGLKSENNLQHVLEGVVPMSEAVTKGPSDMRVLTGSSGASSLLRLSRKRLQSLLAQTEEFRASTDILIVDVASGADARVMTFLKHADEVILVTTPDPTSIVDCYSTAKVLFRHKKDAKIDIVVNRAANEKQAQVAFQTIKSTASRFLHKSVNYLGFVRNDAKAAEIAHTRKSFVLEDCDLPATCDIKALSDAVVTTYSLSHPTKQASTPIFDDRKAA